MSIGILGKKLGMTRVFDEKGKQVPVTIVEAGPCPIVQIRNEERDGYNALQVGFGKTKPSRKTLAEMGHLDKAKAGAVKVLREFRIRESQVGDLKVGDKLDVNQFERGDVVDVVGTSKGRGFAGVVKRHNFSGCNTMTHGTHEAFRHGGSIGCRFPQHVIKGRKMAGQLGNERVSVQNLEVVTVIAEDNLILIRGAIPGPNGGLVTIKPSHKKTLEAISKGFIK